MNTHAVPETPVIFHSQGEQVVGMWHAPAGPDGTHKPAVVMCHGFTGNKGEDHRLFVQTARCLAAAGIGALRFDFRGSGDSAGAFHEMTVSREVAGARAALDWIRQHAPVDTDRVALLGLSLGGCVTALLRGEDPPLCATVLWNPVSDLQGVFERRRSSTSDTELAEWGMVDYGGWGVGADFLTELRTLKPLEAAARSHAPCLIVMGEEDAVLDNAEGYAYAQALRAKGITADTHVVRGAGHTFETLAHTREAIQITLDWLIGRSGWHDEDC